MRTRRRKTLISGPVLVGFADIFDAAHGDPATLRPYLTVTPSSVGGVLLPFPCPHCGAVRAEVVNPKTRAGYHDFDRDFSWCPACGKRYELNLDGVPLAEALPAGATSAPARVERAGAALALPTTKPGSVADGLDGLGCNE